MVDDRRFLINAGPFEFEPGEETTVSYAVIWQETANYPCPDFNDIIQMSDVVEDYFNDITSLPQTFLNSSELSVFPNPMQDFAEVRLLNGKNNIDSFQLFSSSGQLLRTHQNVNSNHLNIRACLISRAAASDGE